MNPCVSVIIPAFNAAQTIKRAILSVVDQQDILEIIAVDDCSTDNTVEIINDLSILYLDIKLIAHERNSGVSAARNSGIAAACGEYIAFLDADDLWLSGKLKKQLAEIVGKDNVALVTCDSLQLDSSGQILKRAHLNRPPVSGHEAWKNILAYNFIPTPTVLVRRVDVLAVGCFSTELPVAEDLDLWIKLSLMGKVAVVPEVLVHYFDYPGSLMKSEGARTEKIVMSMIRKHLDINHDLLTRKERQHILSVRNYDFALQYFFGDDVAGSVPYFVSSLKNHYRMAKSLQYILRAFFHSFAVKAGMAGAEK